MWPEAEEKRAEGGIEAYATKLFLKKFTLGDTNHNIHDQILGMVMGERSNFQGRGMSSNNTDH